MMTEVLFLIAVCFTLGCALVWTYFSMKDAHAETKRSLRREFKLLSSLYAVDELLKRDKTNQTSPEMRIVMARTAVARSLSEV